MRGAHPVRWGLPVRPHRCLLAMRNKDEAHYERPEVPCVSETVGKRLRHAAPRLVYRKVSTRFAVKNQGQNPVHHEGVSRYLFRRRGGQRRDGREVCVDVLSVLRAREQSEVQLDEGAQSPSEGDAWQVHVRRMPWGSPGLRERAGSVHPFRAQQTLQEGGHQGPHGGGRVQGSPHVPVLQEALLLGPGALQPHADQAPAVLPLQEGEAKRVCVL